MTFFKLFTGLVVTVSSSYHKTRSEPLKQQSKFQRRDVKLSRHSFDKLLYIVFVKLDFHPAFWFSLTWAPLNLLTMLTKAYQGMGWDCFCFLKQHLTFSAWALKRWADVRWEYVAVAALDLGDITVPKTGKERQHPHNKEGHPPNKERHPRTGCPKKTHFQNAVGATLQLLNRN